MMSTVNTTIIENLTETQLAEYLLNRDPLHIVVPLTVIYIIIFITGIVGNVSTCIVIVRNKHMHTATNYYLFSLAVSDILLLLSGLPAEAISLWSKHNFMFGDSFCILKGFISETSANATVFTITAFTVERYVAICHPFRSHSWSKLSRAVRLIILTWIVSMSLAVPVACQFGVTYERVRDIDISHCDLKSLMFEKAFIVSSCVVFVLPMTVITVLYMLIGLKLRLSGRMMAKRSSINSDREAARPRSSSHQKHVIKMLVAVVVTFFICWAPFHAQRLYALYLKSLEDIDISRRPGLLVLYESLLHVSGILYYLSTTVNPLLYNLMSHKFRLAFKTTLSRTCSFNNASSFKRSPYGTITAGSQRTVTGSIHYRRGKAETTLMLMSTRKVRRALSAPATPSLDVYKENNNREQLEILQETRLSNFEKPPNLNEKVVAPYKNCDEKKSKSDTTFSCITRKIRGLPPKSIFSRKKSVDTKESLGSNTISNSSLLDLDLSEFTSSELADIIGQMNNRGSINAQTYK